MKYLKALELIKKFEGLELEAYLDGGGVWTIGYGTTIYPNGEKVQEGDKIVQQQADEYIELYFNNMVKQVRGMILFPDLLSENQMSAVLSLVYNIGLGAFKYSTLLKNLNHTSPVISDWTPMVADEFLRWNKDNGKVVAGLTNRRKLERELFLTA